MGNEKEGELNREIREIRENGGDEEISHEDAKTRREKWESEFRPDLPDEPDWKMKKRSGAWRVRFSARRRKSGGAPPQSKTLGAFR
jgi:hypothetical protein